MASNSPFKVFLNPNWTRPDNADGGIRRVVEAQKKHLPKFNVTVVTDPEDADVINVHGSAYTGARGVPTINSCHGLYWNRHEWPDWAHETNRQVVESMIRSVAITAPSEWVAHALTRGMLVYPEVIYHGIDADDWTPSLDPQKYVLWNKARTDAVSDPADMQTLARYLPEINFLSTFGESTNNVSVTGAMPVDQMKDLVRNAGLYLATARETFGIGTLEAMSCGVPVVGWNWGGQSEIIKHGETGFLAEPYDYKALAQGVRWALAYRGTLSENCRSDVVGRWGWEKRIGQYAALYRRTRAWWDDPDVQISVIVTCHNLGRYLDDCLRSVASQSMTDWECLIVDDASTDNTQSISEQWASRDKRFKYLRTPSNLKLPMARNYGFKHSKGRYVIYLDADDMFAENALLVLWQEIEKMPQVHIAYGHLDTVNENAKDRQRNSWPFEEYSWYGQIGHLNQLPYCALMRREVMDRSGGYRKRHWRAEDAPFWIKTTSMGFRAKKVTEATIIVYRNRSDSKSKGEPGDGDWTSWFPWRLGATNGREGYQAVNRYGKVHPNKNLVPWSAQGPIDKHFWPVHDHANPKVSVIIPVGPTHEGYVIDALESLAAQDFIDWEAIVVNATGNKWLDGFDSPVRGAPWAKVVGDKKMKPAAARNLGAKHAKADAILFLDADDMLLPDILGKMYALHTANNKCLVYTDWARSDGDPLAPMEVYKSDDFKCGDVLKHMRHAVTCLIPKSAHDEINGFDETLPGWEDWDYFIALQTVGLCSQRIPEAGFVYRFRTGTIREESFGNKDAILKIIRERYADYYEGRKEMGCRKCPSEIRINKPVSLTPEALSGEAVLLEYVGEANGKVSVRGPATNSLYVFQRNRQKYVMAQDAETLLSRTREGKPDFLLVERVTPTRRETVETVVKEPVFEVMPEIVEPIEEELPDIGKMTVKVAKRAMVDADRTKLLQWMRAESLGRGRITIIKEIQYALSKLD